MFAILLGGWKLSLRRLVTDVWVFVMAAITIFVSVTALAAGPIYADAMYLAGAQQRLADAPTTETSVTVASDLGSEHYIAFDERVTRALQPVITAAGGGIYRSGISSPFTLMNAQPAVSSRDAGNAALTVFQFREGLADQATLVDGAWGAADQGSSGAAISASAARILGLQVGDRLALEDRLDHDHRPEIKIVGIFQVNDPAAAYWQASELLLEGVAVGDAVTTYGPLFISKEAFLADHTRLAEFRWSALPNFDALTVAAIPTLEARVQGVAGQLNDSATVTTQLDVILADIEQSLLATRSSVIILTAQLAILSIYALLQSTRMLVERRTADAMLLRARGAGIGQLGMLAALEGALIILPAVLIGPWLAAQTLLLLGQVGPIANAELPLAPQPDATSYTVAALAGLVCLAILVVPAMWAARSPLPNQGRRQRAQPDTFWQRSGIDLALLAVAVVGFWQLHRYGVPITEMVQGRLAIDPILVAAPALGLLAGAIIALRLIPMLARFAVRWSGPRQRPAVMLGSWQLARRPGRYTRPALLLILALGIGLFALAFTSTWQRSQRDQANYQIGADVRVEPSQRVNAIDAMHIAPAYADLAGVEQVMAIDFSIQSLSRSFGSAQLVVLDADQAAEVVRFRDDLAEEPFATLMQPLLAGRPEIATIPVAGEPARIAVDVSSTLPTACPMPADQPEGSSAETAPASTNCVPVNFETEEAEQLFNTPLTPALVIRDGQGAYHRIFAPPLASDGSAERVTFSLTQRFDDGRQLRPSYPIEIVALEFSTVASPQVRQGTITISGLATSEVPSGDSWQPVTGQLAANTWTADASSGSSAPGVGAAPSINVDSEVASDALAASIATGIVTELGTQGFPRQPNTFRLRPAGSEEITTLPVILSQDLIELLALGDNPQLFLNLGLAERAATGTGTMRAFPGLPHPERPIIIADRETVLAYQLEEPGRQFSAPDEYWLAVDGEQAASVAATLQQQPFNADMVQSRFERARILRNDPVTLSTIGALWLGVALAVIFAGIGFVSSVTVSLRERLTEFGLLQVLGLSRRQLAIWLLAENGFLVIVCLLCGTAVGLALAWLALPLITVSRTAQSVFPVPIITLPWEAIVALQAFIVLLLLVASLVATSFLRRLDTGGLLRMGEDR